MISLHNIHLSFGTQAVYDGLNGNFDERDRIGLVGRNGAGKSTLLKVIAGQQFIDGGLISIPKNCRIAYLPQDIVVISKKTILAEALGAFEGLDDLEKKKEQLENQMRDAHTPELVEEYASVCLQLEELNIPAKKAEVKKILCGLGFKEEQFETPVSTLSGGWKMRLVLAKLLLQKADFYLFDEPTNHLDIVAKDWFLQFLQKAEFGYLLVCHERYVLNKLCTKIVEIELSKAKSYNGNYNDYERQKEHDMAALEKAYEQQQATIKAKMATVDRFKASATKASMAQSMLKKIEKIEKIELPPSAKAVHFQFDPPARPARFVLKLKNVAHAFGNKKIFSNVAIELERGEKVALVAPNGVGKTTLFNLIAGKLPLQQGSIEFGSNVKVALYEQEQENWLDLHLSIFENIKNNASSAAEQKIRALLGAFLFSGDDIEKKAGVLSGGEKSRVGMVRLLLQKANIFLLDEPTNHLDIQSKDILLKALDAYQGTMFFVSHDHDFINRLATRIIELTPQGVVSYPGNYDAYLYARAQQESALSKNSTSVSIEHKVKPTGKQSYEDSKRVAALERKIEKCEKEKDALEAKFLELEYGTPPFDKAQAELSQLLKELELAMAEWEKIITRLS